MRFLLNRFALPVRVSCGMNRLRRMMGLILLVCCSCPAALYANTYYLAPASLGGNDANNGASVGKPWLSPNHSLNCGDVILALASTSYNSYYFNSGHWGNVSCPAGNNVAWLKCETFDGCKMYSNIEGVFVDRSFWGVQGFEVNIWGGAKGFCFGAAPSSTNYQNIHHIIFANNIANGCMGGGFSSFNNGTKGVDYLTIVGNIAYNSIQGSEQCYSAISVFQPIQSDWVAGTHIYVAGNFAWGNYQPNYCGGVQAWGGDGIIFDTLDGSEGVGWPYQAQVVAENNITIGNGGHGIEVQNNIAGSGHAAVYISNNTVWGNENLSTMQNAPLCSEVLLNSAYNVQERWNLVATRSQKACVSNPTYALSAYTVNATVWSYANLAFAYDNQYEWVWNANGFGYDASNVLGVNPDLSDAYVPGAPSCGGAGNVTSCMQYVVNNFKPTNGVAAFAGYHQPSESPASAPLFPSWVCNAKLPAGIVTKPC